MTINYQKLEPYFKGLGDKSRLAVYLLATGEYSFDQVRNLTARDGRKLAKGLPDDVKSAIFMENVLSDKGDDDLIICRGSGRNYSAADMAKLLQRAHKIAGVEYKDLNAFVKKMALRKKK